jgi:hypothetical protein
MVGKESCLRQKVGSKPFYNLERNTQVFLCQCRIAPGLASTYLARENTPLCQLSLHVNIFPRHSRSNNKSIKLHL